ncbi:hypothetical protein BV898_18034 [Hypsibius exemplaris]|uniref:Uncharacterized protein n=1 Tax=Hypsibius exemplaris TaxID=2072580 RepID=A0A9X6RMS2_HYPEX|nr:hypothetical protein BV898_18034 [Hypsibius exemplaris]
MYSHLTQPGIHRTFGTTVTLIDAIPDRHRPSHLLITSQHRLRTANHPEMNAATLAAANQAPSTGASTFFAGR